MIRKISIRNSFDLTPPIRGITAFDKGCKNELWCSLQLELTSHISQNLLFNIPILIQAGTRKDIAKIVQMSKLQFIALYFLRKPILRFF